MIGSAIKKVGSSSKMEKKNSCICCISPPPVHNSAQKSTDHTKNKPKADNENNSRNKILPIETNELSGIRIQNRLKLTKDISYCISHFLVSFARIYKIQPIEDQIHKRKTINIIFYLPLLYHQNEENNQYNQNQDRS